MSTATKNDEPTILSAAPVGASSPAVQPTTTSSKKTSGGKRNVASFRFWKQQPVTDRLLCCLLPGLGSGLKSFISGGVGGICVVLVGHPLDLIKVRPF
jgi:hypothetical protein